MSRQSPYEVAILVALQMCGHPAHAADCTKAYAVTTGTAAPCSGDLLPNAWAAKAVKCLQVDLPACRNDAHLAVALADAATQESAKKLNACETRTDTVQKLLDTCNHEQVAVIERPQWYQSTWFVGVTTGIVVGAFAFGGGALYGLLHK